MERLDKIIANRGIASRREVKELVRQGRVLVDGVPAAAPDMKLSPETAVNVLLACWDFLETGEKPANLSPIESVAFSAFMPDMEEAWARYVQRITARHGADRSVSTDIE